MKNGPNRLTSAKLRQADSVNRNECKSQLQVVEQAPETAAMLLGPDRPRGYCLEMICADFLAGVHLQGTNHNEANTQGATPTAPR
jgi:hypothetical protein